ncbi:S100P protein, partial [Asarcornis scutulata]|nr:S100P protein [Asarcornis scutulata]
VSQMETIAVFDKYAKTADNTQTLTKAELKSVLEKELPNFLSKTARLNFSPPLQPTPFLLQTGKNKDATDEIFRNLDENGDSQVDFKEFVIFVAALTCCCHKYFEQKAAK